MTIVEVEPLFPGFKPTYSTRIYFGLGDCRSRVKIGMTGRPSGRRGGEMHFTEMCAIPGDRCTEDFYHRKYADERITRTEWFWLTDRLLVDLIAICIGQNRIASVETLKRILYERLQERKAAA